MAAILQMTFWNAFSWMKVYEFWLKFHRSLFIGGPINNISAGRRQAIIWTNVGYFIDIYMQHLA